MNQLKEYVAVKTPPLYYDMDNTLVLFSQKGKEDKALVECRNSGYYRDLKPFDNGELIIPILYKLGLNPKILSACIDTPYCRTEKYENIHKYFPIVPDENIILIERGEKKSKYADNIRDAILIDDFGGNLEEWRTSGGIAIKKSSSDKKRDSFVVRDHFEILDILCELGVLKVVNRVC